MSDNNNNKKRSIDELSKNIPNFKVPDDVLESRKIKKQKLEEDEKKKQRALEKREKENKNCWNILNLN